jgi:hypothetical protein
MTVTARRAWEKRPGLEGMTTEVELEEVFDDRKDYVAMLREMADFANGGDAEAFREYLRTSIDDRREVLDQEAREVRRGA